jgi:hypothetical protein
MTTINLAEIQKSARALRRTSVTAIVHSGGKRTIYGCLCGAQHTCATDYRKAKHVADWQEEHETSCGYLFARAMERRTDAWLARARDARYSAGNEQF